MLLVSRKVRDIRRAKAEEIVALEVVPWMGTEIPQLVPTPVVVSDREIVSRVAELLRSARPWTPGPSGHERMCALVLDYGVRKARCQVSFTRDEGVFYTIHILDERVPFLKYGTYRSDRLRQVLEEVADESR